MKKDWYKSKAVQGALLTFVGAVLTAMGFDQIAQTALGVGAAWGIYGIRAAKTELQ